MTFSSAGSRHGYARATRDVDIATHVDPRSVLRDIERTLKQRGYTTRLVFPDPDDPLGGVLTVTGNDFDGVQVVDSPTRGPPSTSSGEPSIQSAAAHIPGHDPTSVENARALGRPRYLRFNRLDATFQSVGH